MWTINHVHQRQSVSLQVIKSFTFKIKSRPNQVQRDFSLLTSLHSCQASILTIQELPTFVKGFDLPTSLDAGVASRHWSQLSTFHTLFLSWVQLSPQGNTPTFISMEVVVASRQHSRLIPCLAVASRQQSRSTSTLHFILLVNLVDCSFPRVPFDTLEYSTS